MRKRGARPVDLIVTDGHDGKLSVVAKLFPATPRQRYLLHRQRTDQIDVFARCVELPDHRLGGDRGDCSAKSSGVMNPVAASEERLKTMSRSPLV